MTNPKHNTPPMFLLVLSIILVFCSIISFVFGNSTLGCIFYIPFLLSTLLYGKRYRIIFPSLLVFFFTFMITGNSILLLLRRMGFATISFSLTPLKTTEGILLSAFLLILAALILYLTKGFLQKIKLDRIPKLKNVRISIIILIFLLLNITLLSPSIDFFVLSLISLIAISIIIWLFYDIALCKAFSILYLSGKRILRPGSPSSVPLPNDQYIVKSFFSLFCFLSLLIITSWHIAHIFLPEVSIYLFDNFHLLSLIVFPATLLMPMKWVLDFTRIEYLNEKGLAYESLRISSPFEHFSSRWLGIVIFVVMFIGLLWSVRKEISTGEIVLWFFASLFNVGFPVLIATILYLTLSVGKNVKQVRVCVERKGMKIQRVNLKDVLLFIILWSVVALPMIDLVFPASQTIRYSNKEYGFSFDYPIHWRLEENMDRHIRTGLFMGIIRVPLGEVEQITIPELSKSVVGVEDVRGYGLFHISVRKNTSKVSEEFLAREIENKDKLLDSLPNFKKISSRIIIINNLKGYEYIFLYKHRFLAFTLKYKIFSLYKDPIEYYMFCTVTRSGFHQTDESYFTPIINSFKLSSK